MDMIFNIILILTAIAIASLCFTLPFNCKEAEGRNKHIVRSVNIALVAAPILFLCFGRLYLLTTENAAKSRGLTQYHSAHYIGTADGYHILYQPTMQMGGTTLPESFDAVPAEDCLFYFGTYDVLLWETDDGGIITEHDTVTAGGHVCELRGEVKAIIPDLSANIAFIFVGAGVVLFFFNTAEFFIIVGKLGGVRKNDT